MTTSAPLILAFGDSLVAGYGLATVDGFAAQLERGLRTARPGARVINAGVAGNTTADALRRLPRVLSRLEGRPDLAVVQLGPNDVLRQASPSSTRANLDAILVEFRRCSVPMLITTVSPPPLLAQRAAAYLGIQEELALSHGAATWPFFPAGVLGHRETCRQGASERTGNILTQTVATLVRECDYVRGLEHCPEHQKRVFAPLDPTTLVAKSQPQPKMARVMRLAKRL